MPEGWGKEGRGNKPVVKGKAHGAYGEQAMFIHSDRVEIKKFLWAGL